MCSSTELWGLQIFSEAEFLYGKIAGTPTKGSSQGSDQLLDTLNSSKLQYLKSYELTCWTAGGLNYCCLLHSVSPKSKKNQLIINKLESHSSWNRWVLCHPRWCTYCLLESDHVHHQQLHAANQCWLYSMFQWDCTCICFPNICIVYNPVLLHIQVLSIHLKCHNTYLF